jgi:hypothetical protein
VVDRAGTGGGSAGARTGKAGMGGAVLVRAEADRRGGNRRRKPKTEDRTNRI